MEPCLIYIRLLIISYYIYEELHGTMSNILSVYVNQGGWEYVGQSFKLDL